MFHMQPGRPGLPPAGCLWISSHKLFSWWVCQSPHLFWIMYGALPPSLIFSHILWEMEWGRRREAWNRLSTAYLPTSPPAHIISTEGGRTRTAATAVQPQNRVEKEMAFESGMGENLRNRAAFLKENQRFHIWPFSCSSPRRDIL